MTAQEFGKMMQDWWMKSDLSSNPMRESSWRHVYEEGFSTGWHAAKEKESNERVEKALEGTFARQERLINVAIELDALRAEKVAMETENENRKLQGLALAYNEQSFLNIAEKMRGLIIRHD